MSERVGDDMGVHTRFRPSHEPFGRYLGLTTETVSRTLTHNCAKANHRNREHSYDCGVAPDGVTRVVFGRR
jgi:hypothetical protein